MNKLEKVAKDIIGFNFPKPMIKKINKLFFDFCRENNIKNGTPIIKEGKVIGYRKANFDWTMTHDFFIKRLCDEISISMLFNDDIPKDLRG